MPMTVADDLTVAIRLACLTEDRTDAEQRALLRIARQLDNELNANVVGNSNMWGPHAGSSYAERQRPASALELHVDSTRVLSRCASDRQHPVALPVHKKAPVPETNPREGIGSPTGSGATNDRSGAAWRLKLWKRLRRKKRVSLQLAHALTLRDMAYRQAGRTPPKS